MAATLLRCILSLKDINSINNSTVWAIRETVPPSPLPLPLPLDISPISPNLTKNLPTQFVAIIAVNAPCIKPLFSTSIWIRSSSKDPSSGRGAYGKSTGASFNLSAMGRSGKHTQLESTASKTAGRDSDEFGMLRDAHNNSSAQAGRGDNSSFSDEESGRKNGGIQVTTMYEVRRDGH